MGLGHLPIRPAETGIDLLTFSGHKIYGPKGVGVLCIARHLMEDRCILPEIDGGGQERGMRGGTLNVPAIVGLQHAYEFLLECLKEETQRAAGLRQFFLEQLEREVEFVNNTPLDCSLPHCLNLSFPGVNGQSLMQALGMIALSSGSACNSNLQQPSHVLRAMGVPADLISASIRLSVGRPTTREDMQAAAEMISREVATCRK